MGYRRVKTTELIRYQRQLLYESFDKEKQNRLLNSHVLVAGIGGLGSPAAIYLACAGIGKLTLVDRDVVQLSNLNRQILHWEEDIGERKIQSAKRKLKRINSSTRVRVVGRAITGASVDKILQGVDVVVDGMDNMKARFIINESCVKNGIPFIHGGVRGLAGQITTVIPGRSPCLECLFPRGIEDKGPLPVFGTTPALIASIQVTETIKLLAGFGNLLAGKMLYVDCDKMEFTVVEMARNPNCVICGSGVNREKSSRGGGER